MNTPKRFHRIALLLCLFLSFAAQAQEAQGAGTTYGAAIYTAWAFAYTKETGQSVAYKASNAADGVKKMANREVDFAATLPPLSRDDLTRQNLIQLPVFVGAVVPVHNIPGVPMGSLRLTGDLLADIFADKIQYWNDAQIAQLNPQLKLPALRIARIVRENGSGTTDAFTRYLSAANPLWKKSFGVGQTISWRGSVTTGDGSDGVAKAIAKMPGAIGYITLDHVKTDRLNYVVLKNRSGKYVSPSEGSISAALSLSNLFKEGDESSNLTDLTGNEVWPILGAAYFLIDAQPATAARSGPTLRFLYWAFLKGDALLLGSGWAPLPPAVQSRAVRHLSEVRPRDGQPVQFFR